MRRAAAAGIGLTLTLSASCGLPEALRSHPEPPTTTAHKAPGPVVDTRQAVDVKPLDTTILFDNREAFDEPGQRREVLPFGQAMVAYCYYHHAGSLAVATVGIADSDSRFRGYAPVYYRDNTGEPHDTFTVSPAVLSRLGPC